MLKNLFKYLETDESVKSYCPIINHQLKLVVNETKKSLTVLTVSYFSNFRVDL